ncbi:LacI family DNA-binding transcriptional regulator [Microbacterium sp.]|uniref:LacI family DNA-binding transcriptional regulator n=1 Tax=Microbacterium sp. TaxID=51671 RepID=UPI0039E29B38
MATRAGVSVGTVSNVLNHPEKVSSTVVDRVRSAISELGYVRNDAARQLRAGRSRSIGLVVIDGRNPFFTDLARGAADRAAEHGLTVVVGDADESTQREAAYLDLFEQQRVFGVLVAPIGDDISRLVRLREVGVPCVLVDRESTDAGMPSVAVDDVAGGQLAAGHLLAIGRRRIAFAGGPLTLHQVADRLEGAQSAVGRVESATLEVIGVPSLTVESGWGAAERILARPPEARPDSVLAANDLVALGIMQRLMASGSVRIPDDIAIVGYDDIDYAAIAGIPLTSVRQPAPAIGATAVDILMSHTSEPSAAAAHIQFRPELVVRASTTGESKGER